MTLVARCPSCGKSLSEASVVAVAPVCGHCGSVLTTVGGTLGLTSAYGLGDPTITRRRVEADIAVLQDYQRKYEGMLQACIEQLSWGVDRYARMPATPRMLTSEPTPSSSEVFSSAVLGIPVFGFGLAWGYSAFFRAEKGFHAVFLFVIAVIALAGGGALLSTLGSFLWQSPARRKIERENARRRQAHDTLVASALNAAAPVKAAQDHRLGLQVRELEGLLRTVVEKEAEVRRILASLST